MSSPKAGVRHLPASSAGHVAGPKNPPFFNEGKLPPLCCSGGTGGNCWNQNCGVRLCEIILSYCFFVIVLLNFDMTHDRRLLFLLFYLGSLTTLFGVYFNLFLLRMASFSERF